jgi:hypothetical protein
LVYSVMEKKFLTNKLKSQTIIYDYQKTVCASSAVSCLLTDTNNY